MRSQGRLVYAPLAQAIRILLLLDSKEPIIKLYLKHAHEICSQAGPDFVKASVQDRFKVLGIRAALRSINYRCFICRRFRAEIVQPEMASLPQLRFPSPKSPFPFKKTGVDVSGPFFIVNGRKIEKQYGIFFNCLVSRACQLESCSNMTIDSFPNAFRRFIARQGHPRLLRSDNGKNFFGAQRELQACLNDGIAALQKNIPHAEETRCNFNPLSAPQFAGTLGKDDPNRKTNISDYPWIPKTDARVFTTILAETELMLNSRPFTHVNNQPETEEPLSPNHFLLHRPFENILPIVFEETGKPLSFNSWKKLQKVSNHFWKRFLKGYLPTLDRRQKWNKATPSLKVNDFVWLLQDFTPRGIWPLGKVTATHLVKDGVTRVCTVKTSYGTFERPAVSLTRVFAP